MRLAEIMKGLYFPPGGLVIMGLVCSHIILGLEITLFEQQTRALIMSVGLQQYSYLLRRFPTS